MSDQVEEGSDALSDADVSNDISSASSDQNSSDSTSGSSSSENTSSTSSSDEEPEDGDEGEEEEVEGTFGNTSDRKSSSRRRVDISGQSFKHIPVVILHRKSVTHLIISRNNISFIPPDIRNMQKLKHLDISHNPLRSILPNLTTRDGNRLSIIKDSTGVDKRSGPIEAESEQLGKGSSPATSQKTPTKTTLPILSVIPEEFTLLTHLRTLLLVDCRMTELPEVLFRLVGLIELDVSLNYVGVLPSSIASNPEKYRVDSFSITQDFKETCLGSLSPIHYGYMQIRNLYQLRVLRIRRMGLQTLPLQLASCMRIERLDALGNNITCLPEEFRRLRKLKILRLEYSHFFRVPREELDSSSNSAEEEKSEERQTKTGSDDNYDALLRSGEKPSVHLPEVLFYLTSLQHLPLSKCRLNTLSNNLSQLKRLEYLDLSKNYFRQLPTAFNALLCSLKYLDLSGNIFEGNEKTLTTPLGRNLPNLVCLKINNMNLKMIAPEVLNGLTYLEDFEMNNNRLSKLPENIDCLLALTSLSAANNILQRLPKSICHLRHLVHLNLSYNSLDELPERLFDLESLCKTSGTKGLRRTGLWLLGNPLSKLPSETWKTDNAEALWKYMKFQNERSTKNLQPLKVIVVGHRKSGKSTLVQNFMNCCATDKKHNSIQQLLQWNYSNKPALNLFYFPSSMFTCHGSSRGSLDFNFVELTSSHVTSQTLDVNKESAHFSSLHTQIFDSSALYIVTFSVNCLYDQETVGLNAKAFENLVGKWVTLIQTYSPGANVKLVGTGVDLLVEMVTKKDQMKSFMSTVYNDCKRLDAKILKTKVPSRHNPKTITSIIERYVQLQLQAYLEKIKDITNSPHGVISKTNKMCNISPDVAITANRKGVNAENRIAGETKPNQIISAIENLLLSSLSLEHLRHAVPISWLTFLDNIHRRFSGILIFKLIDQSTEPKIDKIPVFGPVEIDKTYFQKYNIDDAQACLSHWHTCGRIFWFRSNDSSREYFTDKPALFFHLLSGLLNPELLLSQHTNHIRYIRALSNLPNVLVRQTISNFDQYGRINQGLLRGLLSPFRLVMAGSKSDNSSTSPKQKHAKKNHFCSIKLRTKRHIPENKEESRNTKTEFYGFESNLHTKLPVKRTAQIIKHLVTILNIAMVSNDKLICEPELETKPDLIYPPKPGSSTLRFRIRHETSSKNWSSGTWHHFQLHILFPLIRPWGFFENLAIKMYRGFSQPIEEITFSTFFTHPKNQTSINSLHYKLISSGARVELLHDKFFIILEEVHFKSEYGHYSYGISLSSRYADEVSETAEMTRLAWQSENNGSILQPPFNPISHFVDSCNQMLTETPGLLHSWHDGEF